MATLKQSTAYTRTFLMVDSTDHLSPKTGLTVGVYLSKAGGAFTAVSGSVSELSFGWYKVSLNATDTNTLGELAFHCTGSAADLTDFVDQVTSNILGDTLPANVTQWVGVAPNALISGTVDGNIHYPNPIIVVATGTVSANVTQWKGSVPNDLVTGTVDAFTHYSNPVRSFPTGTVDTNVVQWRGTQPNNLVSGTVDAFAHYGNFSALGTAVGQQRILDRIDYQRGHHTVTGNTFYVDGVSGNDTTGDGSRAAPYQTISKALTVCIANNHDEIVLLPNSAGGPTTITESATIVVSKAYTQIRGPGRDVLVTVTAGANKDVFSITAGGVNLSGFRIATNGASSNGVTVSNQADFVLLSHLWIESAHQDAIQFNVANRCQVDDCLIIAAGRDGVRVSSGAGAGTYNIVTRSVIRDSVGSAINLQGSDASECRIQHNIIRDNAVGITIASGVTDTVFTDNRLVNNTTEISDAGTRTLQQWNYLTSSILGDVMITGTVNANLLTWRGNQPNNLITGTVDAFSHYANPTQAFLTGTVDVNLIQIDGQATNGNNATLNLKQLNIYNPNDSAIRVVSDNAISFYVASIADDAVFLESTNGIPLHAYTINGDAGIMSQNDSGSFGIWAISPFTSLELGSMVGPSINASKGILGDIVGNITGSITGNVYGDIHGYVGWVTGSVQNVLVSTPAAPPTGTVNANVIQWVGDTPNLLISGTVDAFTHYTNYPSSTITGSVDANVIAWRGDVPNLLISGTVDSYAHYISPDAITSIWSNATRTLTSFGTLIADIWSAVVDSSGITTLLSRLTAGRATNLDNLDDAISNVPTANENADALLKRDWTAVTGEAARSVLNALRFIRNKFSTTAHANKVTIYKEDDATEAYQKDVTTDATADPIVEG